MKDLLKELKGVRTKHLHAGEEWQLSYDNASVHKKMATEGPKHERVRLPAKSPDMHKVVEHVHGWLTQKMQKWLLQQKAPIRVTPADAQAELERLFKSYPKESVLGDVRSLPETYKAIIAVDGAYPIKRYR